MGIVKIDDELHEDIRQASAVMSRSINAQAEFWMKIGMMAELHPQSTFNQLVRKLLLTTNRQQFKELADESE